MRTEVLPDGTRRHYMVDGQVFEEDGPKFRLEYESLFPDKTYRREVAVFGLADPPHLFEAWTFVHNALRRYAFHKVIALTNLKTGEVFTGEQLREFMGGAAIERRR